ncbi:nidogen-1-like [Saccoglossus kowalevskii]|uniref:Nidogen-1-like n=1 Tax=Saccoglossus kowalevskii TaxID=10224 RepID=A0ABM0LYI6_SACKO|nr:PREDICTED: nidogen-1-like [Saccoglossus kowalevskii]
MKVLLISVVLLLCSLDSLAVYRKLFYHYGERTGDRFLNRGDVESVEMYLNSPISFYNNLHYTVYINTDGVLTFTPGLQGYPPYPFGVSFQETNIKLIAPFLTDLDNSDEENTGNIWYRETAENDPLHERANKEIQRLTGQHFQTSSLLIVTWEDIAMHHKQGISQLTSFQVVLANDGSSTYAIYLYDDENQSSEINVEYWPLSGFYAGDKSRYYNVPVSDVKDVYLLNRYSNVNTLGFWMWQIGMEDMGNSNIVEPTNTDISSGDGDSVQPSTHDNINPPEPDIAGKEFSLITL